MSHVPPPQGPPAKAIFPRRDQSGERAGRTQRGSGSSRTPLPSDLITKSLTSEEDLPSSRKKAIFEPSGDHVGHSSSMGPLASAVTPVPSAFITYMSV